MSNLDQTEVLVVGAGPVGMFTTLLLAQKGIKTEVIDQASRSAGHSYSCALHPRTLELLDQLGMASEVIGVGRRIDVVGFYEGNSRRAEVKLSDLWGKYPFALVLAQSTLERLLEQRLRATGIKIHWNHRLANLEMNRAGSKVTIEKLAAAGKGFIVPELEAGVEKELKAEARFVIGADGCDSTVRRQLEIQRQCNGAPEYYVVYEVDSADDCGHEARVALDDATTSVFWPISDTRGRWSFQLSGTTTPDDFPRKDRDQLTIVEPPSDHDSLHHLGQLLKERAPWFQNSLRGVLWAVDVQFEPWLARRFGKDRCWLAGDAAHQTSPGGMQSMNLGFREAADLAHALTKVLCQAGAEELLEWYERTHLQEWQHLLRLTAAPKITDKNAPWVKRHAARVAASIPASGEELGYLLKKLGN